MLGQMAVWIGDNTRLFTIIAGVIAAVAAAIIILNAALTAYKVITQAIKAVQEATWLSNPIFLVVAAVILLVAAIVILYKRSATFRAFVDAMWASIRAGALAVVNAVRPAFNVLFAALKIYVQVWWQYLKLVFALIKGAVQLVVAVFRGDWKGALNAVRGIVAAFRSFFVGIFNALPGPVRGALSAIGSIISGVFHTARSVVSSVINGMRRAIEGIKSSVEGAMRGLSAVLSAPFHAAEDAVKGLIGWVSTLLDKISHIKIPGSGLLSHIPGVGGHTVAPSVAGAYTYTADPALGTMAPRAAAAAAPSGPTIIVQGALDPEAVARQIRALLAGHDRRTGLVPRAV